MSKSLTIEVLKKLVTEVRYESVSFIDIDVIDIKKEDDKYTVKVDSMTSYYPDEYSISGDKWENLIDRLYDDLRINKWNHNYRFTDGYILDGESWNLQISVEGRRKRIYRGDNGYPDNWDEFMALIESFAKEKKHEWD